MNFSSHPSPNYSIVQKAPPPASFIRSLHSFVAPFLLQSAGLPGQHIPALRPQHRLASKDGTKPVLRASLSQRCGSATALMSGLLRSAPQPAGMEEGAKGLFQGQEPKAAFVLAVQVSNDHFVTSV